ncbi:MAG: hypothetical protein J6D21_12185 [Clostridia bacterium]|nr:hypothetical protein [Clostridia bacterium]
MKLRVLSFLLVLITLCTLMLASCGKDPRFDTPLYEIPRRWSAERAYEYVQKNDYVVLYQYKLISGGELWDAFYEKTRRGEPAEVLLARYYTIDPANYGEEYYEEIKHNYPVLYVSYLVYDGETYTLQVRNSTRIYLDSEDTYPYLVHSVGQYKNSRVTYDFDWYALTDIPNLTRELYDQLHFSSDWEDVEKLRQTRPVYETHANRTVDGVPED